ncbi:SEC-C domain-containing protein [Robinsoniella peoriensis]|uniref:SEC-C domain-containing protein n=1 Tax=Robinsoniella peoriensis TaxID=180332 RepID=UPI0037518B8A
MILSKAVAQHQLTTFFDKYPNMKLVPSDNDIIQLHGSILVFRSTADYILRKSYLIDIFIPTESDLLPYVMDTGNQISTDYHHYYPGGRLCLATDTDILIRFIDGFDINDWMDEYVEPYFLSYEYFQRYGEFPFGERAHDFYGIVQSYKDHLQTDDLVKTLFLIQYIGSSPYRGHRDCPCGSGINIRKCHGPTMLPFYKDVRLRQILLSDLITIEKGIKKVNDYEQRKYKTK